MSFASRLCSSCKFHNRSRQIEQQHLPVVPPLERELPIVDHRAVARHQVLRVDLDAAQHDVQIRAPARREAVLDTVLAGAPC